MDNTLGYEPGNVGSIPAGGAMKESRNGNNSSCNNRHNIVLCT